MPRTLSDSIADNTTPARQRCQSNYANGDQREKEYADQDADARCRAN
jgi:hypothetical protein